MDEIQTGVSPSDALLQKQLQKARLASANRRKLAEASEDFEALFVYMMLRAMRQTVMKSGLLDEGLGGEIMESMFDQELSRTIARRAHLGIAELLQQQLGAASGEEQPGKPKPAEFSDRIRRLKGTAHLLNSQMRQKLAPFEPAIQKAARQSGLDANLIRAVIFAESSGNPRARSPRGALGLMQLMPDTAREMGVTNPLDPEENILGGTRYLRLLLDRFQGHLKKALAAYNAGPDAVDRYGHIPPYPETRRYVRRIQHYLNALHQR